MKLFQEAKTSQIGGVLTRQCLKSGPSLNKTRRLKKRRKLVDQERRQRVKVELKAKCLKTENTTKQETSGQKMELTSVIEL